MYERPGPRLRLRNGNQPGRHIRLPGHGREFQRRARDLPSRRSAATALRPAGLSVKLSLTKHKHKVRLRISYKLSVADKVIFTLKRSGHKVKGKIVKSGKAGANRLTFNGKIGGHSLGAGTYQLVATPARGKPKKAKFTLTR